MRLLEPRPDQRLTSRIFLRLLALIYLAAFLSLSVQINGLVGREGILPLAPLLDNLYQDRGWQALLQLPTLFWISAEDWVLLGATVLGSGLSLLLLFGVYPRIMTALLFLFYLSLTHAGQIFLNFQWDYLLLEAGFLAFLLTFGPSGLVIFLFHWLLFRLRFLSGWSKLASGDPSWSSLDALRYYFETQPLPHVGAWYAHQLPDWLLQAGVVLVLFAELVVPFFIFLTRRWRIGAALVTIALQVLIILTSNHNFFNLLTIALCIFLLDDRFLRGLLPAASNNTQSPPQQPEEAATGFGSRWWLPAVGGFVLFVSSANALSFTLKRPPPELIGELIRISNQYGLAQVYHVFPVMQRQRQELEIQGSHDGRNWQTYRFRYKPGAPNLAPAWVIPHQPRLDWMIWFVPQQRPETSDWLFRLLHLLWLGKPEVTALFKHNPFEHGPPRYLRVNAYEYRFSSPQQRHLQGSWWQRRYLGEFPQVAPRIP